MLKRRFSSSTKKPTGEKRIRGNVGEGRKTVVCVESFSRPFLRWAGGKQKLASSLVELAPARYNRYFEPFFGGGAVYFALRPKRAVISDVNTELISCYQQVRAHPKLIASLVQRYARQDSPAFFYRMRETLSQRGSRIGRAAKFIYMNKAAFNGIYRVNMQGKFNVPYGPSQSGPAAPTTKALLAAAQ